MEWIWVGTRRDGRLRVSATSSMRQRGHERGPEGTAAAAAAACEAGLCITAGTVCALLKVQATTASLAAAFTPSRRQLRKAPNMPPGRLQAAGQ